MVLRFHEQIVCDEFLVPSFTVSKNELVIIQAPNGTIFSPIKFALDDILTGKVPNDKVEISSPMRFVDYIKESRFQSRFFPLTVGSYLEKHANKDNPIYKKVYDNAWIHPETQIQTIAGTPRKILSLYTTLSWTNNIIFDLAGIDPQGGHEVYLIVKRAVIAGGAAILIDYCPDFKDDCTRLVKVEYLGKLS